MSLSAEEQARLEQLIAAACRAQPPLAAPPTLAARVLAQLEERAQLPAWRRSFWHWPRGQRAAFVLGSAALIAAMLDAIGRPDAQWLTTWIGSVWLSPLARLESTGALLSFLAAFTRDLGVTLLQDIPRFWLYGAGAAVLALYALLAGISAMAYRSVYGMRSGA
jgi:hypothetical protein